MDNLLRERIYNNTLVPALEADTQFFLRRIAGEHDLAFEEIRMLARAARDLEMWRETPLATRWQEWEEQVQPNSPDRKRELFQRLESHLQDLRSQETVYPTEPLRGLTHTKPQLFERPAPAKVFTLCPFFSKDANCCGLHTIEAASGCALGCSFCTVSASLGDTVEFSADLAERLAEVELDPDHFYHVSTGQFSDSLVWGNRYGILDALFAFARTHPNVQLELKTKSDRIDYLLSHEIPDNVLCTWLINTDTIIRNEEHGTATLRGRLQSARSLAHRGCRIGFHINPVIRYRGWGEEYPSLVGQLMALFSPDEVDLISLGAISFTPAAVKEIRRRGGESKVLQMSLVEDPQGKLTYPLDTRVELYSTLYRAMQPWQRKVFVFLCMETDPVWQAVFGGAISVHDELERLFYSHHRSAISAA